MQRLFEVQKEDQWIAPIRSNLLGSGNPRLGLTNTENMGVPRALFTKERGPLWRAIFLA